MSTSAITLAHAPPIVRGIRLVETSILPDRHRSMFKFPLFNAIQSKCFACAYESNNNLVLSAPTGSGKTVIMELAICRLLARTEQADFKIVYQAPTRSLCSERFRDWSKKLGSLGLQCAELTGEVENAQLRHVQTANVIVTTPEKWDSVTRRWTDHSKLMKMIGLFLIDEVHILKESRGATLEAVVSRMKSIGGAIRFIALSATAPNSEDIATWLGLDYASQHLPAKLEVFDESFRPTTLEKHVFGYKSPPNDFILDKILLKELPNIIARFSKRKPVMVFCCTKMSAATTAKSLCDLWTASSRSSQLWNGPQQPINVTNPDLKVVVKAGVAFHHSGLDTSDRLAVENGFVNDLGMQQYTSLEVMQMMGRAGRPQFETSACAVILTNADKIEHYKSMVTGQEILESTLHKQLVEHLNAEICTGTVYDIQSAKDWLDGTFLAVRVRRNAAYYRDRGCHITGDHNHLLQTICERDIKTLESTGLIEEAGPCNQRYRSTEFGKAMARYYVRYETMKGFTALPHGAKTSEILDRLAMATEYKELRLKSGERALYRKINASNEIKYPLQTDIISPAHKASLLIQAQLGGIVLDKQESKSHGRQLKQDTIAVLAQANRLIRCVIDMQLYLKDSKAITNALGLSRSLAAGVWDNTPMQLKQIGGIGDITARKLAASGVKSVESLYNTAPHDIELILGRSVPFGSNLIAKLASFPHLRITAKILGQPKKLENSVEIRLRCIVGFINNNPPKFFNKRSIYVCFLCETSGGDLMDFRRFAVARMLKEEVIVLQLHLDKPIDLIQCHVMCDEIAGTHRYAEVSPEIPASYFPGDSACPSVDQRLLRINLQDRRASFDDTLDTELVDEDLIAAEVQQLQKGSVLDSVSQGTSSTGSARRTEAGPKRKASDQSLQNHQNLCQNEWRAPRQLDNGSWTCQHTCNEEGKACKHLCCQQGVKKPKKRPKYHTAMKGSGELDAIDYPELEIDAVRQGPNQTSRSHPDHEGLSLSKYKSHSSRPNEDQCDRDSRLKFHGEDADIVDISSDDLPSVSSILAAKRAIEPDTTTDSKSRNNNSKISRDDHEENIFMLDWDSISDTDIAGGSEPETGQTTLSSQDHAKQWRPRMQSEADNLPKDPAPQDLTSPASAVCSTSNTSYLPFHDSSKGDKIDGCNNTEFDVNKDCSFNARSTPGDILAHGSNLSNTASPLKSDVKGTPEPFICSRNQESSVKPDGADHNENSQHDLEENPATQQRQKWSALDPWMYQAFGHCIDLI